MMIYYISNLMQAHSSKIATYHLLKNFPQFTSTLHNVTTNSIYKQVCPCCRLVDVNKPWLACGFFAYVKLLIKVIVRRG